MRLDTFRYVLPQPTIFECFTALKSDNEEWILGDAEGRIYSLSIQDHEFIFNKLGEVPLTSPPFLHRLVFHPIRVRIVGRFDSIHWLPLRRLSHNLTPSNSSSKTNSNHKPGTNIRLPRPPALPPAIWHLNNLFRWFRPRKPPRRPSGCRNRRLCRCRFRGHQRDMDTEREYKWNGCGRVQGGEGHGVGVGIDRTDGVFEDG